MPSSAAKIRAAVALLIATASPLLQSCGPVAATPTVEAKYVVTASGRLDTRYESRFLAAERDGRIAEMLVRPGDHVAAGDALLRIGCADLAAEADAAASRADASAAEARLVVAGPRDEDTRQAAARADEIHARRGDAADMLERAEALRASGFVSTRKLVELRAGLAEATAQSLAADAALAALQNGARPDERRASAAQAAAAAASTVALIAQLEKCTLRAPMPGTVLKVLRREGEFSGASTGTPLVVIGDLSSMIVRAELIDRDAASVALGQPVDVWLDGGTRQWRGHVIEAASLMGRRTARSLDPSDRFDRDVREVLIAFEDTAPPPLVGLRVNVGLVR